MIDALELLVPLDAPKNSAFWARGQRRRPSLGSAYSNMVCDEGTIFEGQADGIRFTHLVVHEGHNPNCRKPRFFKVEIKRTRHYSGPEIIRTLQRAFRIDDSQVLKLPISRVDFAADLSDVSVYWFRQYARIKFKQMARTYNRFDEESKGKAMTLTFGTRYDMYRIYDKAEQLRAEGFPVHHNGLVTRLERQCCGKGVPPQTRTLSQLLTSATDLDPFQRLVLLNGSIADAANRLTPREWLMSLGLRAAIDQHTLPVVWTRLNRSGVNGRRSNHASRIFKEYSHLLCDSEGITLDAIRESYRSSTRKQLSIAESIGM